MHEASALNQLQLNYINFVLEPESTHTHPVRCQCQRCRVWSVGHNAHSCANAIPVSILLADLFVLLQLQSCLCLLLHLRLQLSVLPRPLFRFQLCMLHPGVFQHQCIPQLLRLFYAVFTTETSTGQICNATEMLMLHFKREENVIRTETSLCVCNRQLSSNSIISV